MNHSYFILFFLIVFFVGSIQSVYAGGSGSEESDVLFINETYYKVILETNPSVLDVNDNEINFNIVTINDDTQQIVSNVEYEIQIFDGTQNQILEFEAYSPNDKLETIIVPSQNINFLGETTDNGSWIGSNSSPLIIEAPLFLEGGLVDVKITILSINSEPVSGNDTPFDISFTMGQFIPFTAEINDITFDLMFATYFDKIEKFDYNSKNKKITAQMPFDWSEDFIESIPFVHAEYYIPKTIDIFNNHEIVLTINDVSYFGTIDRSGNDEIVVHFLLSSSKLLKLLDDIPVDEQDKMIFGIQSGKIRDVEKKDASLEDGDKVIVLSTEEDWKFHLSLTPIGKINPGNQINLNLEFRDPVTNTVISQILYDMDIFLNGKIIESKRGLETPDGRDTIKLTFDEIGAVIVRISNVNNFDTSGEFSFKVSEPKEDLTGDHFVDIVSGSSLPGCEIDNSCYVPSSLAIQPSEIVLWNNMDDVAHTVTSGTPGAGSSGSFDSGIIAMSETFSFKFENKGNFDYYCTLHPWMLGTISVNSSESLVPEWVKNNAAWWSEGQLSDVDFANGLEFLIKENVIDVPKDLPPSETSENTIPDWLRSNAAWWSEGLLSDSEFLKGIEWMITNGILEI